MISSTRSWERVADRVPAGRPEALERTPLPPELEEMKTFQRLPALILLLLHPGLVHAQTPSEGTVTGIVTDQATQAPLENAAVALHSRADSTRVVGTSTPVTH